MKYHTVFFDADQTLMDFEDAERQALERTFTEHHMTLTENIRQLYMQINCSLWNDFEKALITKEKLLTARFGQLFEKIGVTGLDPAEFNQRYLYNLGFGCKTLDGALELCRHLHQKGIRMYILTNGVTDTQRRRLAGSGLSPYISDIFVSEETGFQKPLPEYFDYVFARIPDFDAKTTLMVGDSLTSDILGAYHVGLDSCWFNPSGKSRPDFPPVNYEIRRLEELKSILLL